VRAKGYKFGLLVVKAGILILYSAGIHFGLAIRTVPVRITAKTGSAIIDGVLHLVKAARYEGLRIHLRQELKYPPARNYLLIVSNLTIFHRFPSPHALPIQVLFPPTLLPTSTLYQGC
jgi:hypothetical protein